MDGWNNAISTANMKMYMQDIFCTGMYIWQCSRKTMYENVMVGLLRYLLFLTREASAAGRPGSWSALGGGGGAEGLVGIAVDSQLHNHTLKFVQFYCTTHTVGKVNTALCVFLRKTMV